MNIGSMLNHYASGDKFETPPPPAEAKKRPGPVPYQRAQKKVIEPVEFDENATGANAEKSKETIRKWQALLDGHVFSSDAIRVIFGYSESGFLSMVKKMQARRFVINSGEVDRPHGKGRKLQLWTWRKEDAHTTDKVGE